jgi:hypothetical protein
MEGSRRSDVLYQGTQSGFSCEIEFSRALLSPLQFQTRVPFVHSGGNAERLKENVRGSGVS